ncbi:hypothetical protein ACFFRR_011017 [Megaselia abdita]
MLYFIGIVSLFHFGTWSLVSGQFFVNQPPHFLAGLGDMSRFSLPENTQLGSPVYQLKGVDPEGSRITYSISGPVFSVDRLTGVVYLRQELDRETQNTIEVIISITDEGIIGKEPNTVSLRREIPIRDYNDNTPLFIGRPYRANVSEASSIGTQLFILPVIQVVDYDEGINADVDISCYQENVAPDENGDCDLFNVKTSKLSDGNYTANIALKKQVDYESKSSYVLTIMARDNALENQLTAYATVSINILDVQDQPPIFVNPPYSAIIKENTPKGVEVLNISAIDGDFGHPREVVLTIENELFGHFELMDMGSGKAVLITTDNPIDRERPEILENAGVYTFDIRASEINFEGEEVDFSVTQVTLVVTDEDDNIPLFNKDFFNITIPENLEKDMPLPGLTAFVDDMDMGENSKYELTIKDIENSEGVFYVYPSKSQGRTPIVIKVKDSKKLDYDVEDETKRVLEFYVVASVKGNPLSKARVQVNLQDINDNSPMFSKNEYKFKIEENLPQDTEIGKVSATDKDSGQFGVIEYVLKGFGSENFYVNKTTGILYVKHGVDFEFQSMYSLTIVAVDGGGLESNAYVFIEILDINDNPPVFENQEYTRTIREGGIDFEPQFYVRAYDVDGPTQGNGKVKYAIDVEHSVPGNVFHINEETGELTLSRAANSKDTETGEYDLTVSATDFGEPPLKGTTKVLVRVGISGNQRPIFKGHARTLYDSLPIVGPPRYKISIPETAKPGDNVTIIAAHDPDGLDSLLKYQIVGANDNFVINETSGLIKVSSQANFDRDSISDLYEIVVNAVDTGVPFPETATSTVYVNIKDVNDEPPKFTQPNYIAYISERSDIGADVIKVLAHDKDFNSKLDYRILKPVKAITKAGVITTMFNKYNPNEIFAINNETGQITVSGKLSHDEAAVVSMMVEVEDLNAEINKEEQIAYTEVVIYVQSFKDTKPVFKNRGWSSAHGVIDLNIKEEMPIGSVLMTLFAEDPVNKEVLKNFQILNTTSDSLFALNGADLVLIKRLDYEALPQNSLKIDVKVSSYDNQRSTLATLNITVENVNDNSPEFEQSQYRVQLMENKKNPKKVLVVSATDKDAVLTARDDILGFHRITYSLQGEHSLYFEINNKTGEIIVAANQTIDREKTPVIRLKVRAEDAPGRPTVSRYSLVNVVVDILDENDNAPKFTESKYTAVIPETAIPDTFVLQVLANDPDFGPSGEVRYDLIDEDSLTGLFKINFTTGEIRTRKPLTGKGRAEPYRLVIRGKDNGALVAKQESLSDDVYVDLFIGDVSANDGIPYFIHPKVGQVANISENVPLGTPVFQVLASDPDSPDTASGQLFYKIIDDIMDSEAFKIDTITGLITTMVQIDREIKDMYNIIIEVSDSGEPRQSTKRVLKINVLDIDDHEPRFERDVNSQPLEMSILEEQPMETIVGNLTAIDEDMGANAEVDFMIIYGNHEKYFDIKRTSSKTASIITKKRIDKETVSSFLLTVKCFKFGKRNEIPKGIYNRYDFSEIRIKIDIIDIDDNLPVFTKKDPTIGLRSNAPLTKLITIVNATDKDSTAEPIHYSIVNISFVPQFYKRKSKSERIEDLTDLFILNNMTGELKTGRSFSNFLDGYFNLIVKANNSMNPRRYSTNTLKIFIIRDKSLLKFVFTHAPSNVETVVEDFQRKVQERIKGMDLELHILETQALVQSESLDITSTASCFQIFQKGSAVPLHQMQKIINSKEMKQALLDVYVEYGVSEVESCNERKPLNTASLLQSPGTWLVFIAVLTTMFAIIATCKACCMKKKYKKQSKESSKSSPTASTRHYEESFAVSTGNMYGPL